MTDWIDKAKEKLRKVQKTQEQQARYWQIFPPLARQFWEALGVSLARDVQRMNEELLDALGSSIDVSNPLADHIRVQKLTYPAHYVEVALEVNSQSLHVEHERVEHANSKRDQHKEIIRLYLDDQCRNVYAKLSGKIATPDQVSEYVLSRMLDWDESI